MGVGGGGKEWECARIGATYIYTYILLYADAHWLKPKMGCVAEPNPANHSKILQIICCKFFMEDQKNIKPVDGQKVRLKATMINL